MKTHRPSARFTSAVILSVALLAGCSEKPEALIDSAKNYLAGNDHNAAAIQLRNALQQEPDHAEARYLLGRTMLEKRDYLTAEKELRRALELGYPVDLALPPLAMAMVEIGNGSELLERYGDRQLTDPAAQAVFQTALGNALLNLGKLDEAETAYARALQAQADHLPARAGQARVLAASGDPDGAARLVETTLQNHPDGVEALMLRAELLAAERKFSEAQQVYARVVDLQPDNQAARRGEISVLIPAKEYAQAAARLAAARELGGDDPRLQYLEALLALREDRFQDAIEHAQHVLKGSPDHVPSLMIEGAAQLQLGAYVRAESALQKVLDRLPQHEGARQMLVTTQLRMGQAERAMDSMRPLLSRVGDDAKLLALAGEVHMANNDMARASEYFERSIKLDGSNAAVRARLGQVNFASGDQERGIEHLEEASSADAGSYRADLVLVLNHLRNNELDKAVKALKTLEQKQPNNPVTHNVKGVLQLAQKEPAAARASFEHALTLKPDYYPALINLARLDIRDEQPQRARQRFEEALSRQPGSEQLLLGYANVLSSTGAKHEEVAPVVERAVEHNPASATAHVTLINYHRRAENRDAALAAAHKALAALPNNTAVMEAAGQALLAGGETQQAISTFQKLANAAPSSPNGPLLLAQAYAVEKNVDAAVQSLRKALSIRPELSEARAQIVGLLAANGRMDDALAESRALQQRRPKDALGYALEGDVLNMQQKWSDAERSYREALKLAPDNTAVFVKLHRVLTQRDQQAAASLANQWVKAHPQDMVARSYIAERELHERDYASAITHYKAILKAEPRNALALNNIAWAAAQQQDPEAVEYAQKAYDLAPTNPAIMDTLGTLLVNKGEIERGLPLLEQAVKLAPEAPMIRINYAKALIKAGNNQAARSELQSLTQHENAQVKAEAETLLKTF